MKLNFVVFFRAFDIELLYIAETFDIEIHEVAVNWQEIDGKDNRQSRIPVITFNIFIQCNNSFF